MSDFFYSTFVNKVEVVVCVQVNHARQNRFGTLQLNDLGVGQNLLSNICVDLNDYATLNNSPYVKYGRVTDAVK